MTRQPIDLTARCDTCTRDIEHYAGIPGSVHMTPYWRHVDGGGSRPHPAVPREGSITAYSEASR